MPLGPLVLCYATLNPDLQDPYTLYSKRSKKSRSIFRLVFGVSGQKADLSLLGPQIGTNTVNLAIIVPAEA